MRVVLATGNPGKLHELRAWLEALGRRAVQASAPFSDNSTAAVLRWHG